MVYMGADRYKSHPAWAACATARTRLARRMEDVSADELRRDILSIVRVAERAQASPDAGVLYVDQLDALEAELRSIPDNGRSLLQWKANGGWVRLAAMIRALPDSGSRGLSEKYIETVDELIAARQSEVADLREDLDALGADLTQRKQETDSLETRIDTENDRITQSIGRITQVAESAQETLDREWKTRLEESLQEQREAHTAQDRSAADQIEYLRVAAEVGQRLVEHAAGQYTALNWTKRATRERRSGLVMRVLSIGAFVGAIAIATFLLADAWSKGVDVEVGGAILRAALVLSAGVVGGYLATESRRHYREAASAEEVAASLTTLESYYASSDGATRAVARKDIGDTVFVKNVLSRFSNRDAARNSSMSNQQMTEVVDLLTKSAAVSRTPNGS